MYALHFYNTFFYNFAGAGSSVTTAQPTSSITEAVVSESDLSANRDDNQENQFMEVDDSLEPMVLLAPDGGKAKLCLPFRLLN